MKCNYDVKYDFLSNELNSIASELCQNPIKYSYLKNCLFKLGMLNQQTMISNVFYCEIHHMQSYFISFSL
jgi:hypothetical protein